MKEFIRKYDDRIHGVLSCFDRMLFRGYLPIMSGWAMAEFLYRLNVNFGPCDRLSLGILNDALNSGGTSGGSPRANRRNEDSDDGELE